MTADVRLGSKYISEVPLDLKGQCFLSWKEKSQKKENMKGKGIAMPFLYGSFSDLFFFFWFPWLKFYIYFKNQNKVLSSYI